MVRTITPRLWSLNLPKVGKSPISVVNCYANLLINQDLLAYTIDKLMFRGVSRISKNFKGVMISDMDLILIVLEGLREFSALILWDEKKWTLFYIYWRVCSRVVFSSGV